MDWEETMQMTRATFVAALLSTAFVAPARAQSGAASDPAIGVYRFGGGREVYVEYLPDIDGLAMMEFPSGRIRPLRAIAPGRFAFGPSIGAAEPVEATLEIAGARLHWTEAGRRSTGRRVEFASEEVTVQNGVVALSGTLTRPRGRGPFPAVVLLHGGGAQTRDFFWVTHFFAVRGVAVLAYDKRGAGRSTGDWRTARAIDLAEDGLAALAYLRSRADIRRDRIGFYGSSAGGWTAPLAAGGAPADVAFVVVRSGSYLPERQNIIYEVEGDIRSAGFGDDEVAQTRQLHALAIAANDQESWERFRTALSHAQDASWFPLVRLPRGVVPWDDAHLADIRGFIEAQHRTDFDVLPTWAQLRMPVLYQVGGLDRYVPGPESAARIGAALADNPRAEVCLYPRGDHPMFESVSGYPRDIPRVSRYAEGYLRDLDAFIRRARR